MSQVIRRIIIYYGLFAFFVSLNRAINSAFILSFGISAFELGMLEAVGFISYLAVDIISSYLFDAKSRRLSMVIGLLLFALANVILVFAQSINYLIADYVLTGLANALFAGSLGALLIEWLDDKSKLRPLLLNIQIIDASCRVLAAISGLIAAGYLGFRLVYLAQAAILLVCASITFYLLPVNKTISQFSGNKLKADIIKIATVYLARRNRFFTMLYACSLIVSASIFSYWAYFVFGASTNDGWQTSMILIGVVTIAQMSLSILSSILLKKMAKITPLTLGDFINYHCCYFIRILSILRQY